MKIVIVGTVASSILGFRASLLKKLVIDGHQVYALATDYDDESISKVEALGVFPILYKLNRSGLNPISDIVTIMEIKTILQKLQPDLCFSYFSKPVILGSIAAKLAGIKKIYGMIEGLGYVFSPQPSGVPLKLRIIKFIMVLLYRISLPLLDKVIFLNPDDPVDLLTEYNIKVRSVGVLGGIGLNLNEFSYSDVYPERLNFIFIGRLLLEKGIRDFLLAAEEVKKTNPSVNFTVLGEIDPFNSGSISKDEIEGYVKNKIVCNPGYVNNVKDWLKESSVFVLPSYYREGVPRSTQEAMAIGRAVLTTDLPGCRETVVDGINGFLVPHFDSMALSEKMIWFVNNPDELRRMGIASREMAVKLFDENVANRKLIEFMGLTCHKDEY